jgi:hypothetical protein
MKVTAFWTNVSPVGAAGGASALLAFSGAVDLEAPGFAAGFTAVDFGFFSREVPGA